MSWPGCAWLSGCTSGSSSRRRTRRRAGAADHVPARAGRFSRPTWRSRRRSVPACSICGSAIRAPTPWPSPRPRSGVVFTGIALATGIHLGSPPGASGGRGTRG
ncbi:MAG: hypothetical protein MZW92_38575 [Comamonadaceae bacterium]|nr:hypothetical protein [Comamonadaceae bacterium]